VLDRAGRVIGVASARADGAQGIAFAVPIAGANGLPAHPFRLSRRSWHPPLVVAVPAGALTVAAALALLWWRRRRRSPRPAETVDVRLRPGARRGRPITSYEPDHAVRLKSHPE
jgi:hypothetical protein